MGSSGGGSGSQTGFQSAPIIPGWLKPYYKNTVNELTSAQSGLPSLLQQYANTPQLGTAQLTPDQLAQITGFSNAAANPQNAAETAAGQGYSQFLGQNGQPSEATQAALTEFNALQSPAILSQAALMGQGNSGAALSALAQGQESALVPFMQQDLQNQLAASSGLASLGGQEFSNQQTALQNALSSGGLVQQTEQQQLQNLFNQQQQQQQLAQQVQMGGQGQFSSLIGGGSSTANFNTSSPKF